MPFCDGTFQPPSMEDVRNSIQGERISTPITYEMKKDIDNVVSSLSGKVASQAIVEANQHLYKTLRRLARTSRGLVDIVLPTYNSLHLIKRCVSSVMERTDWPFHLYIVDDASDVKTKKALSNLAESCDKITLITNRKNRGFAATVNRGMRAGQGLYICWLNSDVVVTKGWLTKMMLALISSSRNQIVCPATNNTAVVEVPLQPGASYLQMNRILEMFACRRYPEIMPTGFCMLHRRSLLDEVGYLDEAYKNYGEDTDFWWRTIKHAKDGAYVRYKAVLADDCYVFHQRSGSFSSLGAEAHQGMRKLASGRFNRLWPEWGEWRKGFNPDKALMSLRSSVPPPFMRAPEDKYRICWVVMSAKMCGGMKYIADIINHVNERGGNAKLAVVKRSPEASEQFIAELATAPVFFESMEDFVDNFTRKVFPRGTVVAAVPELSPAVAALELSNQSNLRGVLHLQSYEPDIVSEELRAKATNLLKTAPSLVASSSFWVTKEVQALGLEPFMTVSPGVDRDLFYPRDRASGDERLTVMIPMITGMQCKGFDRGLMLISELERLADEASIELRILVYGCDILPIISDAVCLGVLEQTRLAAILGNEVDVFVDPSYVHSYGMPALEAFASGVKVFSWDNKGINEYIFDAITVFSKEETPTNVATEIIDYLSSPDRDTYKTNWPAIDLYLEKYHDRARSVETFIDGMEKHLRLSFCPRRIAVVVPHLRKFGGPTTLLALANELSKLGHNVSVTTVYKDINDAVVKMTDLPIRVDSKIDPCDLVIVNSDNPKVEDIAKLNVKTLMIKLSHNPRFKAQEELGLNQDWDAIVTPYRHLLDICENPTEGWDYPARKATYIGWWHYTFDEFKCAPSNRVYHPQNLIRVGTLIHSHPTKGTQIAIRAIGELIKKYGSRVVTIGIGEVPGNKLSCDLPGFRYLYSPSRSELAEALQQCDIWLGASTNEGLGRMGLEAMSAGAAVVLTDTGAEYARDFESCCLFPVGDFQAAYERMSWLIENPEKAAAIRLEGYREAEKAADATSAMQRFQDVIDNLFIREE